MREGKRGACACECGCEWRWTCPCGECGCACRIRGDIGIVDGDGDGAATAPTNGASGWSALAYGSGAPLVAEPRRAAYASASSE